MNKIAIFAVLLMAGLVAASETGGKGGSYLQTATSYEVEGASWFGMGTMTKDAIVTDSVSNFGDISYVQNTKVSDNGYSLQQTDALMAAGQTSVGQALDAGGLVGVYRDATTYNSKGHPEADNAVSLNAFGLVSFTDSVKTNNPTVVTQVVAVDAPLKCTVTPPAVPPYPVCIHCGKSVD